jgi:hypothetical protein
MLLSSARGRAPATEGSGPAVPHPAIEAIAIAAIIANANDFIADPFS